MATPRMGRISVFCSYAREDQAHRQRLEACLEPLRAEKVIDDWYDDRIMPAARWNAEIGAALDRARLVLFIVSPDLLASAYVRDVELPRSLDRERDGLCQIVPIVVRRTEWSGSPLSQFQALPPGAKPIESYRDPAVAHEEVVAGLRDVCKRIVDWENPYKRAQVGDWTRHEQTTTLPDGRSVTVETTVELVKKTAARAVARVSGQVGGESQARDMTIELTEPLADRLGDLMGQLGEALPANAEMRVGPRRFEEETVSIGGKRYETIRATRQITFAQRGWEQTGSLSTWRCIDVPLDGIVKAASDLPGIMRQNMVLLEHGHGKVSPRKPRAASKVAPTALMGPGHWRIQTSMLGVVSGWDLLLRPDGQLQGTQALMGMVAQLQGRWAFDRKSNTLALQLMAILMGMPAAQERIQIRLTGTDGARLLGADTMGRAFTLQRRG